MYHLRHLFVAPAIAGALILSGCQDAVSPRVDDIISSANDIEIAPLVASLQLEPGEREQVTARLEELHEDMLAVHGLYEAIENGRVLSEGERAEMDAAIADVHARHEAFIGSLTNEQREAFFKNAHAQVEAHQATGKHRLHSR